MKQSDMKQVQVKYFALLREQAAREQEPVEISATCKTYGDLYAELAARHSFSLPVKMIQVAVNDEFARMDSEIETGARVVFIPPVAGG